jgi:hypothetical protein
MKCVVAGNDISSLPTSSGTPFSENRYNGCTES